MGKPFSQRPLRFIDIETLGLEEWQPIIEIAIVDSNGVTLFHEKISPPPPSRPESAVSHPIYSIKQASAWAIANSGYLDAAGCVSKEWEDAAEFDMHAEQLLRICEGCQVWGHNVYFDVTRIQHWLRAYHFGEDISSRFGVPAFDTATLIAEHCGWAEGASLARARTLLRIETGRTHTALADARACQQVHKKLCQAGQIDRMVLQSRAPKV